MARSVKLSLKASSSDINHLGIKILIMPTRPMFWKMLKLIQPIRLRKKTDFS